MKSLRKYVKSKPYLVLSAPTVLCFVTFLFNFISAIRTGNIDHATYQQLLLTVDGFGTVCTVLIMLVLKSKKK